ATAASALLPLHSWTDRETQGHSRIDAACDVGFEVRVLGNARRNAVEVVARPLTQTASAPNWGKARIVFGNGARRAPAYIRHVTAEHVVLILPWKRDFRAQDSLDLEIPVADCEARLRVMRDTQIRVP